MTATPALDTTKLNDLRSRIVNEEEVSNEEIAEAIKMLREHRQAGTTKKNVKREKKPPQKIDVNDLL